MECRSIPWHMNGAFSAVGGLSVAKVVRHCKHIEIHRLQLDLDQQASVCAFCHPHIHTSWTMQGKLCWTSAVLSVVHSAASVLLEICGVTLLYSE